jgi:hypothetical protein
MSLPCTCAGRGRDCLLVTRAWVEARRQHKQHPRHDTASVLLDVHGALWRRRRPRDVAQDDAHPVRDRALGADKRPRAETQGRPHVRGQMDAAARASTHTTPSKFAHRAPHTAHRTPAHATSMSNLPCAEITSLTRWPQ